jgi:sugar phosphate isomerase/epimerase
MKTTIALDDGKTRGPMDLDRVFRMFAAHGYRGYMGLEYESDGDPKTDVPKYLRQLKDLAVKYSG